MISEKNIYTTFFGVKIMGELIRSDTVGKMTFLKILSPALELQLLKKF